MIDSPKTPPNAAGESKLRFETLDELVQYLLDEQNAGPKPTDNATAQGNATEAGKAQSVSSDIHSTIE